MKSVQLDNISTRAPHNLDKGDTKKELEEVLIELNELQNATFGTKLLK